MGSLMKTLFFLSGILAISWASLEKESLEVAVHNDTGLGDVSTMKTLGSDHEGSDVVTKLSSSTLLPTTRDNREEDEDGRSNTLVDAKKNTKLESSDVAKMGKNAAERSEDDGKDNMTTVIVPQKHTDAGENEMITVPTPLTTKGTSVSSSLDTTTIANALKPENGKRDQKKKLKQSSWKKEKLSFVHDDDVTTEGRKDSNQETSPDSTTTSLVISESDQAIQSFATHEKSNDDTTIALSENHEATPATYPMELLEEMDAITHVGDLLSSTETTPDRTQAIPETTISTNQEMPLVTEVEAESSPNPEPVKVKMTSTVIPGHLLTSMEGENIEPQFTPTDDTMEAQTVPTDLEEGSETETTLVVPTSAVVINSSEQKDAWTTTVPGIGSSEELRPVTGQDDRTEPEPGMFTTESYEESTILNDNNSLGNSVEERPEVLELELPSTSTQNSFSVPSETTADFGVTESHSSPNDNDSLINNRRKQKEMNLDDLCPCDETKTTFDPTNCLGGRMTSDPNCPCREMCARQSGESCSTMEPCDRDFGLQCNLETEICQGPLGIEKMDITHRAVKLRWDKEKSGLHPQASVFVTDIYRGIYTRWTEIQSADSVVTLENLRPNTNYFVKVEEDGKQEITTFRTLDGCIYNATLSYGMGEKFNLTCNETCTCHTGGELECHSRCFYHPEITTDPSCIVVPNEDDSCCVKYQCRDSSSGSTPKILVTHVSPSTLTVVWDDFKLPSHHSEYVLEYRMADNDNSNENWKKALPGEKPLMTLTQLKPNTPYEVKVTVWENDEKKLESTSEVVTVYTDDGCVRGNQTYRIGDEFFQGCDLRCICLKGDEEQCSDRCNSPYVKIGSKVLDPVCYEKPLPTDPCCVMVRCTERKSLDSDENEKSHVKPGECPEILGGSPSVETCLSDCDHDTDCTGHLKCCPSSCGGAVCLEPIVKDICKNIYCGPNALCIAEKMSCECISGFEGNPHDFIHGCEISNSTNHLHNQTQNTDFPVTIEHKKDVEQNLGINTSSESPSNVTIISAPTSTLRNNLENNHEENKLYSTTSAPDSASEDSSIEDDNIRVSDNVDVHAESPEENTTDEDEEKESNLKGRDEDAPIAFDGCEFRNITYDRGTQFDDGCEARCSCDGFGHVSCVPRCSVMSAGGFGCQEVPDPDDNCCKIMLCSFPGSHDSENVDGLSLKILSAQPQNGTTVRIRIALPAVSQTPGIISRGMLETWYLESTEAKSGISQWSKKPVMPSDLMEVHYGVYEYDISGLKPDTDYYFKVAKESSRNSAFHVSDFSNTVNAKTFLAAVKGLSQGCFHHNQSYNLGEIFYEGCEFKCICREKGFIECQDRCQIYVDTVGYEGCEWVPSEEDPCCTIPSCSRRKIPVLPDGRISPFGSESVCVINTDEVYRVGDMWELDDGCKTKICRCSLLQNGSTEIQCQSDCPSIPPNAHMPTAQCPKPVLVQSNGPCSCPYIICSDAPRHVVQPTRPQCEYKGKYYDMGEEFHDGCISLCHCGQDVTVNCAAIECPYHFSAEFTNCVEWDIDPDFFPTPPHCCAPSKCKNDGSCMFNGMKFNNFEDIPSNLLPCGTRCVCVNGNITCENRCPPNPDTPPANLPCPSSLAHQGHPAGEDCCLQWMCREPIKRVHCTFQGARYLPSERWEVRKGNQRRLCTCQISPIGNPEVECKGGCPQIPQRFLLPTEQCALPVIVTPDDPVMCPYVVCNNTHSGQELHSVSFTAMNSTAVRIRFTLPNIMVGLIGHAELHFTTDPTLPPSDWHVQKFARPKRLFDSPNIEYILNALRPNTTYFLQVKIRIDALQGGPESELFKLRMPEEIMTTSTTTLPSIMSFDAKLEAHMIDANTVRISWRNFEPQEKSFIYALQLKYKAQGDNMREWILTPMIHRDVTSYFLHDLRPSTSYSVDLVFTPPKDLPNKLVSIKPIEIHTSAKRKDDFDLQIRLEKIDVESQASQLLVSGIPEPIAKYVHVVKILYKVFGGDQQYTFKLPKSSKISLDHLMPGKRYIAQMELYLTNGKTLTSNEVEFITKPMKVENSISPEMNAINDHVNGKQAEPLQSKDMGEDENKAYFIALVVVAVVAAVAGFGFILLLILLVRRQASAKAPISRTPSESAYDNPTYKTYDGERPEDKTNGQVIQTTQA